MPWTIDFFPDCEAEFDELPADVQDKLLTYLGLLAERGPQPGRPYVDTLHDSKTSNLKELRFTCAGEWRFAFAFDPKTTGIILVVGDKEGANQKKFYKRLIATAEARYAAHLKSLKGTEDDDT